MVKLTESQRQIKRQLDEKFTLSPGWFNVGDAVVHQTDPYGAMTLGCYVGFFPADPGCLGSWTDPSNVSSVLYDNGTTMANVEPWYTTAGKIGGSDTFVIVCPREGVFWAHGTRMVMRQLYAGPEMPACWYVTCEYSRFTRMIDGIAGVSVPDTVDGEVAFLNGANGEWTNKDDVRRAKQRRQARQPRRAKPKRPRGGMALSHCAQKYARAIADPFNPASVGACVPVYPAPPSYKVTAHQRVFTVTVGSMGVGCFRFNPCPFANRPCVAGTTSAFDGTTLEDFSPTNSEWTSASFSTLPFNYNEVQARVVSASARVTYTGTALDLSGMFVSMVDPDHDAIGNTLNLTSASSLPYARVENTKRRMNNLSPVFGIKPHETDYTNLAYPLSAYGSDNSTAGINAAPCAFLVTGVPGTTFNVELIMHVEYIGRAAVAGLSKSHTDSRGFEMVQQAGSQLASYLASTANAAWPTMRRLLVEAGREVLSSQLGVRVPMLEL